jgi:phasin
MVQSNPNRQPGYSSDAPKSDAVHAIRESVEQGAARTKETYDKMTANTKEITGVMHDACSRAVSAANDYNSKILQMARTNSNAAFDYVSEVIHSSSLSEVMELSTAHSRKHFETVSEQTKELTALAQHVMTQIAEPIRDGIGKVFNKAA